MEDTSHLGSHSSSDGDASFSDLLLNEVTEQGTTQCATDLSSSTSLWHAQQSNGTEEIDL